MFSLEIVFLGLALAMDAAVVSFALGLLNHDTTWSLRLYRGVFISSLFGFFQFAMLWGGSLGGFIFTFSSYGYLFQFVVASVFFLIGIKFFSDSLRGSERQLEWAIFPLLLLGIATSMDALVAGISLGTLPNAHLAALMVGMITIVCCALFYTLAQFFKKIPEKWMLRLASFIFFSLAANIVWTQVKI